MIETRHLKNVVIFFQTILSFVLSRKIKYLLCIIDLFSKYGWVSPLKDKRRISIVNAFQKVISKGRKLNKIWIDQGGEFCYNFFKRFSRGFKKFTQHTLKEKLLLLRDSFGH